MKRRAVLTIVAAVLGFAGNFALADEHLEAVDDIERGEVEVIRKELAKLFTELDTDKDGKIGRREADALTALVERFNELDKDDSGNLNQEEFAQCEACADAVEFTD